MWLCINQSMFSLSFLRWMLPFRNNISDKETLGSALHFSSLVMVKCSLENEYTILTIHNLYYTYIYKFQDQYISGWVTGTCLCTVVMQILSKLFSKWSDDAATKWVQEFNISSITSMKYWNKQIQNILIPDGSTNSLCQIYLNTTRTSVASY